MKKLYGAIVWHGEFLALEKRRQQKAYPTESYVTFLTGANLQPLTDADIDRMRDYAKEHGIILTTNKVTSR